MSIHSTERMAWEPSADFLENANVLRLMAAVGVESFDELERFWCAYPAACWAAIAKDLGVVWLQQPSGILDTSRGNPWPNWFPGGLTNMVASCVDKHDPRLTAYVWEGEEGSSRTLTYGDLSELVSRIAGGLRERGVGRRDRVGLFMPLIPEAYAVFYAAAKIGAIAVPMFSGYGAEALAKRLLDAQVRVLITADGSLRRGRVVDMLGTARQALRAAHLDDTELVIFPRIRTGNWDDFLSAEPVLEAEPVPADHPFAIVYTSGTTGQPKGAVHTHGGFPLKSASEISYHVDQRPGELFFWMTDPGWIVAPLTMTGAGISGNPLLLYDGAPDHPDDARVAQLIAKHEVSIFGASPTFVRALMGREHNGFDGAASNLRVLVSSGEPWNEAPWWWFFEQVGSGRCPIVNLSGGTEAGALLGVVPIRPLRPCCFNTPCIGIDADVVGADGQPVPTGTLGELVIRQPWPGQTLGLWDNSERYLESYWSQIPGVWTHGDWASRSGDGFWYLHGRSDDTIMIAGKRLGPTEVEGLLATHPDVTDAAAIGVPDEVKGEALWCFVVAQNESDELAMELSQLVSSSLGKSFHPARVLFVAELPKTRTGKTVRRAIKATVLGTFPGDLSTLDKPSALEALARYSPAADY